MQDIFISQICKNEIQDIQIVQVLKKNKLYARYFDFDLSKNSDVRYFDFPCFEKKSDV